MGDYTIPVNQKGNPTKMNSSGSVLSKISAIIALALPLGYVIGWVYRLAYLKAFDAQWLIYQYPLSDFLWLSIFPAWVLFFCFFPHSIPEGNETKSISQRKIWICLLGFFSIYVISLLLIWKMWALNFWALYAIHIAIIGPFGWLIAVLIKTKQLKFNYSSVITIIFTIFLVFYMMPTLLGSNKGESDAGGQSTLPIVKLKSNEKIDARLLLHVEDRFYVTILSENKRKPEVSLLNMSDIKSIHDINLTHILLSGKPKK